MMEFEALLRMKTLLNQEAFFPSAPPDVAIHERGVVRRLLADEWIQRIECRIVAHDHQRSRATCRCRAW